MLKMRDVVRVRGMEINFEFLKNKLEWLKA